MTPTNPDALADAPYVLLKRGLFERPSHYGYTGVLRHAGRFSHKEASACAGHGDGVTMMLASEAPAYSTAYQDEIQFEDLLNLLCVEREAKEAALVAHQQVTAERDEARAKQRDMHRRAQKAESFRERHRGGFNYLMNGKRKERFARRAAEAALATATSELARLRAEGEAKDRALLLLLPFVDYAAGEGLAFVETEDGEHPEMDAADIMAAAAEALGLELGSDAYLALLPAGYDAIRAARAATAREG